jgi:hypothetical protein
LIVTFWQACERIEQTARRYLRGCFADDQIEQQLVRMRLAAERLVSS